MTRRTYWHLEQRKKKPDEYDIVTSKLLYYRERGFEVQTPIDQWYAKFQRGSRLVAPDWEQFRDPRATTYASYVALAKERETFVDGILETIDDRDTDPATLRMLPVLRYPLHGLQMVASYLGSMAPGGRLVVCFAFQAGDEMRRVQRLAYRMRQVQVAHPGFGDDAKTVWTKDPAWQPLRRLVEELLVTYDWGEAFVALNVVVKPILDDVFARWGNDKDRMMLGSFAQDHAWHRAWTEAALAIATYPRDEWVAKWQPLVDTAVSALGPWWKGAA